VATLPAAENNKDAVLASDGSALAESKGAEPYAEVSIVRLVESCERAIGVGAQETKEEFDANPLNLLAAYGRVSSHIELYLTLTNPELVHIGASAAIKAELESFRQQIAELTLLLGKSLRCAGGFLDKPARLADSKTCQDCLDVGGFLAGQLAEAFAEFRENILKLLPDLGENGIRKVKKSAAGAGSPKIPSKG
jgi:hypothetical protein